MRQHLHTKNLVSDNFDAYVHSEKELKETYNLATIIAQLQSKPSK